MPNFMNYLNRYPTDTIPFNLVWPLKSKECEQITEIRIGIENVKTCNKNDCLVFWFAYNVSAKIIIHPTKFLIEIKYEQSNDDFGGKQPF